MIILLAELAELVGRTPGEHNSGVGKQQVRSTASPLVSHCMKGSRGEEGGASQKLQPLESNT